jgi:hypothetical protein
MALNCSFGRGKRRAAIRIGGVAAAGGKILPLKPPWALK